MSWNLYLLHARSCSCRRDSLEHHTECLHKGHWGQEGKWLAWITEWDSVRASVSCPQACALPAPQRENFMTLLVWWGRGLQRDRKYKGDTCSVHGFPVCLCFRNLTWKWGASAGCGRGRWALEAMWCRDIGWQGWVRGQRGVRQILCRHEAVECTVWGRNDETGRRR